MDKPGVVATLEEVATLMELYWENPFKVNAHRNAARELEILDEDLGEVVAEGRLSEIKGFGEATSEKILELWWDALQVAQPILEEL